VIANAGHTPDSEPCGDAMAIDFIRHLRTNPRRCRHAGSPPAVIGRPARRAAHLAAPAVRAPARVRRAVAVALATIADAESVARYAQFIGRFDALRGGRYVATKGGLRIEGARVVTDAVANGTLNRRRDVIRARLRLRGVAVAPARLTLHRAGKDHPHHGERGRPASRPTGRHALADARHRRSRRQHHRHQPLGVSTTRRRDGGPSLPFSAGSAIGAGRRYRFEADASARLRSVRAPAQRQPQGQVGLPAAGAERRRAQQLNTDQQMSFRSR
jgi:hypothetical protein